MNKKQQYAVPIVPYVLEQVECLLQTVGLIIFSDDHIVAAAGHHKYNGSHIYRYTQILNHTVIQSIRS